MGSDFFASSPVDADRLRRHLPFLRDSKLLQQHSNILEVFTAAGVTLPFFGGMDISRVGAPEPTADGVAAVASFEGLWATKFKTILQRA